MKYLSWLLLAAALIFNLILYYPESKITLDPNDNVFQYALVLETNKVWHESHCPLSLNCLPNLIDHWVPNWAEGYPLPFYYSHLPQIAIVSSYNLFIHPLFSLFHIPFSLFQYYTWIKYLLLCFFPLPIFIALRVIGINPIFAVLGAFLGSHLSTDGLYGIDPPSYLWRGYGLTSQLYSVFFIPLAIAFTFKTLISISPKDGARLKVPILETELPTKTSESKRLEYYAPKTWIKFRRRVSEKFGTEALAIFFTTLSIAGHLGIGVILLLTLPIFLFIDFKPSHIKIRAVQLAKIVVIPLFALSYWILPAMMQNKYHLISFWDPIWKFNSYGYYEVIRQFFSGEIFDWKRFPIITILVTLGFFNLLLNKKYRTFSLAFFFWILLYFGRATWGGLIDLIPGMKDFHQSRFIVGVQIASLFLIPAGISFILEKSFVISSQIRAVGLEFVANLRKGKRELNPEHSEGEFPKASRVNWLTNSFQEPYLARYTKDQIVFYIYSIIFISIVLFLTLKQSIDYASLNNRWIGEANSAYHYGEKDFNALISALEKLPPGRIYTGRPGNWGRDFRYSSTQMYMSVSILGFPISQFLPESWSPNSDNEEMFDERQPEDYNLYNLRYIVSPAPSAFTQPKTTKLIGSYGPYYLYQIPTSGYFDIVSSNIMVDAQKTNYVDIVHVWQKSFVRYWNMYPLITIENKKPPPAINRSIKMTDLVSYEAAGKNYSLFGTFPFSFPEATISGKIIDLSNDKPSTKDFYKAKITIPQNCLNCFTIFKMSYHPNWQATLDGNPVDKYTIFPFYMAVATPPGDHTIEFTYHPSGLKIFLLIIEFVLLIGYILRNRVKKLF